jgi:hypothetical protein
MAKVVITGADNIRKNLKLAEQDMKKNVLAGMINAARLIKRDVAVGGFPTTPLDLGNLRASFFISTILGTKVGKTPNFKNYNPKNKHHLTDAQFAILKTSHAMAVNQSLAEVTAAKNLTLIMGYGANYAIWVHEMPETTNWSKDGSGPKWFEKSLKRNKDAMLKLIGVSARIQTTKGFTATKNFSEARTDIEEV